jgi:homospermidine synthase
METQTGINSQLAQEIGVRGIAMVKDQAAKGRDMYGAPFIPYSKKYAAKKGYTVNMRLTHDMINSIQAFRYFERGKTVIIITPTGRNNKVKSWVHHTGAISGRRVSRFRMPRRAWFGLQQQNLKVIKNMQIAEIERFLKSRSSKRYLF